MIDWEDFRPIMEEIYEQPRNSNAGRRPIDSVLMFKMLVLQQLYNIGDDELEYQVNDHLSFLSFLHLGLEDAVPDAKTVWPFKAKLSEQGLVEDLFEKFETYLESSGYQAQYGQIIDATLVPVPKQHNRRSENAQIKQGKLPESWDEDPAQARPKKCGCAVDKEKWGELLRL